MKRQNVSSPAENNSPQTFKLLPFIFHSPAAQPNEVQADVVGVLAEPRQETPCCVRSLG